MENTERKCILKRMNKANGSICLLKNGSNEMFRNVKVTLKQRGTVMAKVMRSSECCSRSKTNIRNLRKWD